MDIRQAVAKHWPAPGIRWTCTAYYGPNAKEARAAVLSELRGVQVPKSHKDVQWGNWLAIVAKQLGITSWTCHADMERQINEATEQPRRVWL